MEEIKIKLTRNILFSLILFLGLTLVLNTGFVSAADGSSITPNTSNQSLPQLTNDTNQSSNSNSTNSSHFEGTTNGTYGPAGSPAGSTSATKTIKVLIYNGAYSIVSCVDGIETALDAANLNHLVPGYNFTYATSTVINSASLSGYDLLAMPGGNSGSLYISSGSISATAIKNFVASGKGFLGICAGAYAASAYVEGYYYGWGIAPHVYCKHPDHEGLLNITITATGQQLFGYGGNVVMAHYNGPAMYASGGSIVTFATYTDNAIGTQGMGAIVGDYYGKGRVVLSGPHPELDPQFPDIVANLVVWAANVVSTPTNTVTMDQLGTAAASVKTYYETNKALPNYVTINSQQITMPQFIYLLATGTVQANSGITTPITVKSVNTAPAPSGTFTAGNIQKSEYVQLATTLTTFINSNGRVPNYISTSLGKIPYAKAVYMFSKIMSYYKTYGRLPNYVSMA